MVFIYFKSHHVCSLSDGNIKNVSFFASVVMNDQAFHIGCKRRGLLDKVEENRGNQD
jgi:hypothetical protein